MLAVKKKEPEELPKGRGGKKSRGKKEGRKKHILKPDSCCSVDPYCRLSADEEEKQTETVA